MNLDDVKLGIKTIQAVFGIERTQEEFLAYSRTILKRLIANEISLYEFNNFVAHFIDTKEPDYKRLPVMSEILKFCGKLPKTVEQMAEEECSKAFNIGSSLKVKFNHPVTNYVVLKRCGGLDNFVNEYICRYKEDKKAVSFKKKEFVQDWIMCYENRNYSDDMLICSGYVSQEEPCLMIETNHDVSAMQATMLEHKKTQEAVKQIANTLKLTKM